MQPHIILLMNNEKEFLGGISPELLMECDDDGDAMIFDNFEKAKLYQDENGVNGRVVPLPIY